MNTSEDIAPAALAFSVVSFIITTWLGLRTKHTELKLQRTAREEAAKEELHFSVSDAPFTRPELSSRA